MTDTAAFSSSTIVPVSPSPSSISTSPIFVHNVSHVLPVKLDRNNFLLWLSQSLPILRLHNAICYVDGSHPCPSQFVLDKQGNQTDVDNQKFLKCQTQDWTLLS